MLLEVIDAPVVVTEPVEKLVDVEEDGVVAVTDAVEAAERSDRHCGSLFSMDEGGSTAPVAAAAS